MGLRRMSMSPAFVPSVKELIRLTTIERAKEVAERVLSMQTVGEIRGFLTKRVRQVWPTVSILDTNR